MFLKDVKKHFIDPVFFLEQIADTGLRFFLTDYKNMLYTFKKINLKIINKLDDSSLLAPNFV